MRNPLLFVFLLHAYVNKYMKRFYCFKSNKDYKNVVINTFLKLLWGSASDWSLRAGNWLRLIRSTTQIWVVTRHQYGISVAVYRTSFRGETSGGVAKCRLFSQHQQPL